MEIIETLVGESIYLEQDEKLAVTMTQYFPRPGVAIRVIHIPEGSGDIFYSSELSYARQVAMHMAKETVSNVRKLRPHSNLYAPPVKGEPVRWAKKDPHEARYRTVVRKGARDPRESRNDIFSPGYTNLLRGQNGVAA